MPANTVVINDGYREYYVGDSKMPILLAILEVIGLREKPKKKRRKKKKIAS